MLKKIESFRTLSVSQAGIHPAAFRENTETASADARYVFLTKTSWFLFERVQI
jgi:hypothetical protein